MEKIKLLYIDLFCGAGGTSTGVESARHKGEKCAKVIACVNHDANAIASHAANHPDALHFTEDIRTLELLPLILHIEKMKAKYPEAPVVLWASLECTNFSKAKGGQPRDADSRTLAEHLFRYIEAIDPDYIQIENVEEFMSWGDLDEKGKPISKDKGARYLQWVEHVETYGYTFKHRILNAADYGAYTSRKRFFGIFAKHGLPIVFPEPTHTKDGDTGIFGKLESWKPVREVLDFSDDGESIFERKKPLVDATLERIYAGLIKFVAGGKDKFIQQRNTGTPASKVVSVDRPARTITATGGNQELVSAHFISKYYSGRPDGKNISVDAPAGVITTIDHHSFISAYYGNGHNHSVDAPAPVVTCKDRLAKIQPKYLCSYSFNDKAKDINHPCPTLLTKDRLSLVSPHFIVNEYSGGGQHSSIDEVCPAILTMPKQKVVSCKWLLKYNSINGKTGNHVPPSIDEPCPVVSCQGRLGIVQAHYLLNPQYSNTGGSIEKPCFTLIARMDKMPPYLISTETGELAIVTEKTDTPAMRKIKEFMALYGIIDIKMRMLKIPELKRIMGFPEDYTLIGTQADQKKYIGNAVEVNMAKCLCEALVTKLYETGICKIAV
ncbi:MAG: DNA cytosine methyltransferase [Prevotella sp.]|jgi:DNA (cytosine-5)-methyltransferase 1|nr:DNA cytosine methyltransferase [Prevotella sp.]